MAELDDGSLQFPEYVTEIGKMEFLDRGRERTMDSFYNSATEEPITGFPGPRSDIYRMKVADWRAISSTSKLLVVSKVDNRAWKSTSQSSGC
eukprot:2800260-Amphidinium_carterae.2